MGRHYKAEQFIAAMPGTGGIISTLAKRVGCDWHTAKKYIEDLATVRQAYQDECETVLDVAESLVITSIQKGKDIATAKWYLSRKGKDRGYSERTDIKHEGTGDHGEIEVKQVGLTDAERQTAIQAMLGDGRLSETPS